MTEDWLWKIRRFLDKREATPDRPFWFMDDESDVYCYDCIQVLKPGAKMGEDYIGGLGNDEEDSPLHCERCGALLGYVLTDYGVDEELYHFIENPPNINDPDECYELARIAYGVFSDEQKRQFKQIFTSIPTS